LTQTLGGGRKQHLLDAINRSARRVLALAIRDRRDPADYGGELGAPAWRQALSRTFERGGVVFGMSKVADRNWRSSRLANRR
jgi:hypothetical protein